MWKVPVGCTLSNIILPRRWPLARVFGHSLYLLRGWLHCFGKSSWMSDVCPKLKLPSYDLKSTASRRLSLICRNCIEQCPTNPWAVKTIGQMGSCISRKRKAEFTVPFWGFFFLIIFFFSSLFQSIPLASRSDGSDWFFLISRTLKLLGWRKPVWRCTQVKRAS